MSAGANTDINPWVSAGLADFIVFDAQGVVTQVASAHLQGIQSGDSVFARLPVLSGFEDMFNDAAMVAQPIRLAGVVLPDHGAGRPLDFSIGLSSDAKSGLLLVTPNFSQTGPDADRLRKKRKQAYLDDLLAQERARFEEIYRQSPVSAFALGKDGAVIAISDQLQTWLGLDTDVQSWIKAFCRTHRGHWQRSFQSGSSTISFRSAVSVQGTSMAIVDVSVFVLDAVDDGQETYIALQDVTAATAMMATLSRQRAQLAEAAEALQTSNRRLEQFAHVAAHDLLGPLGRMSSFSDIIELELGSNAKGILATAIDAIRISARESIDLVQDLLTLAKLQYFEPEPELIDLESCVADLKNGLLRDLEIDVAFSGTATINADRRLLELILRNALSNSYKYRSHERPLTVQFSLEANGDDTRSLSIADNGTGFDDKKADPFAAFERMREHSGAQGTGLGLAMVKDAADTMGWQAGISSVRNEGTRLVFRGIM